MDDDGHTLGHVSQYSAASAVRINALEEEVAALKLQNQRLQSSRQQLSNVGEAEESPFDIPDGLSTAPESIPDLVSDADDTVATATAKNEVVVDEAVVSPSPPTPPLFDQTWTRGCHHRGCTGGCGSGGDDSSTTTAGSSTRTSSTAVSTRGHVRGAYAATSPSFTRSGGVNLSTSSFEQLTTAIPNVSFRSEEAATRRRTEGVTSQLVNLKPGDFAEVALPKAQRLKPGDNGYREQREELLCKGKCAPKESAKLGGWDYDVHTVHSKGSKTSGSTSSSDESVKAYTSNAKKFRAIKKHLIEYDLMQVVYIFKPKDGIKSADLSNEELTAMSLEDIVDVKATASFRDLFDHWATAPMEEIELTQRIYNLHPAVEDVDRESSNILYQVVKHHLTDDFQDSVDRAYKKTFSEERGAVGGISYLFAVLRKVLIGTRGSVDTLFADFKKFTTTGPAFLNNGENIAGLAYYLKTVLIEPIASMEGFDASRGDPIGDLLQGLSKSSCPVFAKSFENKYSDHIQSKVSTVGALHFRTAEVLSAREIADKMNDILEDAQSYFDLLVARNEYVTKSGKTLSFNVGRLSENDFVKAGCRCFNCGGPHRLDACPEAHVEARIKKNRDEYMRQKQQKRSGGGDSSTIPTRDTSGSTNGGGGGAPKPDFRKRKGNVQFKCATCNRWGNHITECHKYAKKVGPAFSMARAKAHANHPGVKMLLASQEGSDTEKKDVEKKDAKAFDEFNEKWQTLQAKLSTQPTGSELHTELTAEIQALTANFRAQNFC